jgi:hypothetical protein
MNYNNVMPSVFCRVCVCCFAIKITSLQDFCADIQTYSYYIVRGAVLYIADKLRKEFKMDNLKFAVGFFRV